VVTHAFGVCSRLEECVRFAPPHPMPDGVVTKGEPEMARAARRQSRRPSKPRRASRTRSAQLEQLNLNAAGIDVGAESHWVAVPCDRDEQPVQCFGAFTADLYALAGFTRKKNPVSWIRKPNMISRMPR
jgi:hypothetical protein